MISIFTTTSVYKDILYLAVDHETPSWSSPERDVSKLELRYYSKIPDYSHWQLLGSVNSLPFTFEDYPELLL